MLDVRQLPAQCFHGFGELRFENQHLRRSVLEDVLDFRHGQAEIDRRNDVADGVAGAVGFDEFTAIGGEDRNTFLAAQAQIVQRTGQAAGAFVELAVGEAAILEYQRFCMGVIAGVALEKRAHGHGAVVHP